MADRDYANLGAQIDSIFMQNLGRHASSDEITAHARYVADHPNEGQAFILGNLNTQLASSAEAAGYRGRVADEGEVAKEKKEYEGRAPMRAQMYSDLQDQAMQILGRGQSALRQNLAQRGLQDSGGMGKGMTELGLGANRMVAQGANAINLEDLNLASQAGDRYIDWQRKLETMGKENEYTRGNMAYATELNRPRPKSWWDYLTEGAQAYRNIAGGGK